MTAQGEDQFGWPVEAEIAGGTIDVTPEPNRSAFTVQTVTVVSAGTDVPGPNVAIPDGFAVRVKQRSTQGGNPTGRLLDGFTGARILMKNGQSEIFKIQNMNQLDFDSDTNGTVFELYAEQ